MIGSTESDWRNYAADYSAGHRHDIEEFGGEWYLISPDGTKVSDEH